MSFGATLLFINKRVAYLFFASGCQFVEDIYHYHFLKVFWMIYLAFSIHTTILNKI